MLVFYSLAGVSWYKKEGGSNEQCDKAISKGELFHLHMGIPIDP